MGCCASVTKPRVPSAVSATKAPTEIQAFVNDSNDTENDPAETEKGKDGKTFQQGKSKKSANANTVDLPGAINNEAHISRKNSESDAHDQPNYNEYIHPIPKSELVENAATPKYTSIEPYQPHRSSESPTSGPSIAESNLPKKQVIPGIPNPPNILGVEAPDAKQQDTENRISIIPVIGLPSIAPPINISSQFDGQGSEGDHITGVDEQEESSPLAPLKSTRETEATTPSNSGISSSVSFPTIPRYVQASECDLSQEKVVRQFMSKAEVEYQSYQKFESDSARLVTVLDRSFKALHRDLAWFEKEDMRLVEMNLEEVKGLEETIKGTLKRLGQFDQMRSDLIRSTRDQVQMKKLLKEKMTSSLADFQKFLQSVRDYDQQLLNKMDILESKRQTYQDAAMTPIIEHKLKRIDAEIATGRNLHATLTDLSRYLNDSNSKIITRLLPELEKLLASNTFHLEKMNEYDTFLGDARTNFNLYRAHIFDAKVRLSTGSKKSDIPKIGGDFPSLVVASEEETSQERSLAQLISKMEVDINKLRVSDDSAFRSQNLLHRCRKGLDKDIKEANALLTASEGQHQQDLSHTKAVIKSADKKFGSLKKMVETIARDIGPVVQEKEGLLGKFKEILKEIDSHRQEIEILHSGEKESLEHKKLRREELQMTLSKKADSKEHGSDGNVVKETHELHCIEGEIRGIEDRILAQQQLIAASYQQEKDINEKHIPQLDISIKKSHDIEFDVEECRMNFDHYTNELKDMKTKFKSISNSEQKADADLERQFSEAAESLLRIDETFRNSGIDIIKDSPR